MWQFQITSYYESPVATSSPSFQPCLESLRINKYFFRYHDTQMKEPENIFQYNKTFSALDANIENAEASVPIWIRIFQHASKMMNSFPLPLPLPPLFLSPLPLPLSLSLSLSLYVSNCYFVLATDESANPKHFERKISAHRIEYSLRNQCMTRISIRRDEFISRPTALSLIHL